MAAANEALDGITTETVAAGSPVPPTVTRGFPNCPYSNSKTEQTMAVPPSPQPAPGSQRPMVVLDWTLWCARHLEPFRKDWPKGASIAMMALFDAAVKMPAIQAHASHDANKLTQALRRFAPLCCFVSPEILNEIYRKALGAPPHGLNRKPSGLGEGSPGGPEDGDTRHGDHGDSEA